MVALRCWASPIPKTNNRVWQQSWLAISDLEDDDLGLNLRQTDEFHGILVTRFRSIGHVITDVLVEVAAKVKESADRETRQVSSKVLIFMFSICIFFLIKAG